IVAVAIAMTLVSAGAQPASQGVGSVVRVYVAPLPAKPGSEQLGKALTSQLRSVRDVTLVADAAAADATLRADGEVWINGPRSRNRRSGRLRSNGTAVYGGSLSVELPAANGETLWSDLASENTTEDAVGSLVKPIMRHLVEARRSQEEPALAATRT